MKSRQVGYQAYSYSQLQSMPLSIPISTVNPERCLLVVRDISDVDGTQGKSFVYYAVGANAITINSTMYGYGKPTELHVDWELIEFY